MIPDHKTVPTELLPRGITVRCQHEGWEDQQTYEGLVGSSVEQKARGAPDKTVDINVVWI